MDYSPRTLYLFPIESIKPLKITVEIKLEDNKDENPKKVKYRATISNSKTKKKWSSNIKRYQWVKLLQYILNYKNKIANRRRICVKIEKL